MKWIRPHWWRCAVLLLVLVLSGCIQPGPGPVQPEDPTDPKPPPAATPEAAATNFGTDYSTRLATVAGDIAARAAAGEFDDLTAVNDAWVAGSKSAREQSQAELIRAMNQALQETEGHGSDAVPLFQQLAAGFQKGGSHDR